MLYKYLCQLQSMEQHRFQPLSWFGVLWLVCSSKPQLEYDCTNEQLFDEKEGEAMGCLWKVRQTCATDPFSVSPLRHFQLDMVRHNQSSFSEETEAVAFGVKKRKGTVEMGNWHRWPYFQCGSYNTFNNLQLNVYIRKKCRLSLVASFL